PLSQRARGVRPHPQPLSQQARGVLTPFSHFGERAGDEEGGSSASATSIFELYRVSQRLML
ncbi:MAG: hypothetical protein QMD10_11315, partial [Desulfitobacteriaceae bacterium]|nr:hypothetical protein [Desulfitobacteriaceae bacterium]